ncbi:hypothetical protein CW304_12135 [Bacillus sp. UFRGS-B20]|nr:hypothetical protein CW304_12135 [Bacillus sp. UFRGS-B20]
MAHINRENIDHKRKYCIQIAPCVDCLIHLECNFLHASERNSDILHPLTRLIRLWNDGNWRANKPSWKIIHSYIVSSPNLP